MKYVIFSLFLLLSFAPAPAHAGFFGPIISAECKCERVPVENGGGSSPSAPAYGCVLQTLQYVVRIVIAIAFVLVTLAFVYAGFVWMTSAGNPGKVEQGKHLLVNTLLGMFLILGAWLLIDFVMKTVYREGAFGAWNNILAGDGTAASRCLVARQPQSITNGALDVIAGQGTQTTGGGANCPAADPAGMQAFPSSATDGGAEKATPSTVQNFLAMRQAALADRVDLKVTDGYRSDSEQVELWARYNHDTSQVAQPCSLGGGGSNHNSGTAVDIAVGCAKTNSNCSSPAYRWLQAHGAQWGFRNALPNDVVHWSPSGH